VPTDPVTPRLPTDALDAFLDGILAELRSSADQSALKEIRAAFKKKIPLPLRSYAAAILIFRAAGLSRGPARPGATKPELSAKDSAQPKPDGGSRGGANKPGPDRSSSKAPAEARPRLKGESATIFFSMGKRQRLYPRALIDLLKDEGGLALEEIGEVRAFDNYCFADIASNKASGLVAALDGKELRGRKLSVSFAKKKDEATD
jgi:hypothetical protein